MGKKSLVNNNFLNSFIFYQYKPFKVGDLIKYSLLSLGAAVAFFTLHQGLREASVVLGFGMLCVFIYTLSFSFFGNSPKSRFTNDGVVFIFFAIVLNLESSQMLGAKEQAVTSVVFLVLLLLSAIAYILLAVSNIKKNAYMRSTSVPALTSLLGAIIGYLGAVTLFPSLSQNTAERLIAFLLLGLSFMVNTGIISFLKLFYYCRAENCDRGAK